MRAISAVVGLVVLAFLCIPTWAQYTPGDVVFTDGDSHGQFLWGMTRQGRFYTVTRRSSLPLFWGWSASVAPAPDNRSLWVSGGDPWQNHYLSQVAPDGSITTLLYGVTNAAGIAVSSIDVDGAGDVILGHGSNIVKRTHAGFTTIHSGAPLTYLRGGGIDLTSGDLVVVDASGIFRVSLRGPARVSTVMTGLYQGRSLGAGLHDDPETGEMVGSWGDVVFRLVIGSPGALTTLDNGTPFRGNAALDRDPQDGQFLIPSGWDRFTQNCIFRFDARFKAITRMVRLPLAYPRGVFPTSVTVAGSRHIWAVGKAQPGKRYALVASFPSEPGALYAVGVSFGFRPGIPVSGRRKIYLNPDALFHCSLTNSGIFSGFGGVLSAKGEGFAAIAIPRMPGLSGLRFFASAVTIVNNRISSISEPLGVTIQ